MVQIIWHFFEFFKKGFPFLDKNGCKILCFFKDATIYAMKFCPVKKRRQKNYGRWFQPSALWSILNMSEKFIPKLIKTLINQSYKMQQDTWNTRLEASYASLWGLPIVNLSTFVLHSSRPKRMVSKPNTANSFLSFLHLRLYRVWTDYIV